MKPLFSAKIVNFKILNKKFDKKFSLASRRILLGKDRKTFAIFQLKIFYLFVTYTRLILYKLCFLIKPVGTFKVLPPNWSVATTARPSWILHSSTSVLNSANNLFIVHTRWCSKLGWPSKENEIIRRFRCGNEKQKNMVRLEKHERMCRMCDEYKEKIEYIRTQFDEMK